MTGEQAGVPITPSETVLLWPEVHPTWGSETAAPQARHMPVAHARAMVTTALLALERAGDLGLEISREKRFLGHTEAAIATSRARSFPWPAPSLESFLQARVGEGVRPVAQLVFDWLGGRTTWRAVSASSAAKEALERGRVNLTQRGAMVETGRRRFRTVHAPREDLAQAFPVRVDLLVRDCFTERRAVWDRLSEDVFEGLAQRVARSSLVPFMDMDGGE